MAVNLPYKAKVTGAASDGGSGATFTVTVTDSTSSVRRVSSCRIDLRNGTAGAQALTGYDLQALVDTMYDEVARALVADGGTLYAAMNSVTVQLGE